MTGQLQDVMLDKPTRSSKRMRQLQSQSPVRILQQARSSYLDFFHESMENQPDGYGPTEQADTGKNLLEMADLTSGTSGIFNQVFGGETIWTNLNTNSNLFGAIPKSRRTGQSPYGWRAKTAFATTGRGGQSEGSVPTAAIGSYAEVAPDMKETAFKMQVSGMQQDLVDIDDAYGRLSAVRGEVETEHRKQFERALTLDTDTTTTDDVESIDRVTSSSSNAGTLYSAASDADVFGIDRSANTWANAQQNENGDTNRAFTLSTVNTNIRNVRSNGGNPTFLVTGWDTWEEFEKKTSDRGRHDIGVNNLSTESVNESDTPEGKAVSTFVNTYQSLPIIVSNEVATDGISRIYTLDVSNPEGADKPRLGMDVVRPTRVFTAGEMSDDNPLQLQNGGYMGDEILAHTRAQLGCRFFSAQGQIIDLKAS